MHVARHVRTGRKAPGLGTCSVGGSSLPSPTHTHNNYRHGASLMLRQEISLSSGDFLAQPIWHHPLTEVVQPYNIHMLLYLGVEVDQINMIQCVGIPTLSLS